MTARVTESVVDLKGPEVPVITGHSDLPAATSTSTGADVAAAVTVGNVSTAWRAWWTWTPSYGTWNLQLPWSVITANSTVVMTVSEIDAAGNRFVASAPFQISSIAPANGLVTFKVNIGWTSPIPMRTDVLVFI
ncbi:hypothetical protein OK074_7797 [Actinobacteria bacterium OK074]|nr:hypothetical protein OK074_7797 [Actinobacteria bacterium OK074]